MSGSLFLRHSVYEITARLRQVTDRAGISLSKMAVTSSSYSCASSSMLLHSRHLSGQQSADDMMAAWNASWSSWRQGREITLTYDGLGRLSGGDHRRSWWSERPTSRTSTTGGGRSSLVATTSRRPPWSWVGDVTRQAPRTVVTENLDEMHSRHVIRTVQSNVEVTRNVHWVDERHYAVENVSELVKECWRHGLRSQ